MPTREREWVSISVYARLYGVDRKTVYKWLDLGLLETFRVHRLVRIRNVQPASARLPRTGA